MDMKSVTIAGKATTKLVLGTLTMSPIQANLETEAGGRLVARALQEGVRWIDTAQLYGSYRQIRRGLELAKAANVFISSKSTAASASEMAFAVDEAMQEMRIDHVDVFLLHAIRSEDDWKKREPALRVLQERKRLGTVSAIGISTHSSQCAKALAADPRIEVLHLPFNCKGIGITDGKLEDVQAAAKKVKDRGGWVYAMKPLGGGYLHNEADQALAWARDSELLDGVAVGMTSADELEMALRVFRHQSIFGDLKRALQTKRRKLFINHELCTGCGRCVEFCDHGAAHIIGEKSVIYEDRCIVCGYCIPRCPQFAMRII